MRSTRGAALVVTLIMALGACAADDPEAVAPTGGDELSWNDDVDLSDLEIAVGSKSSIEQQVLGHLAIEALAASGAQVIDQVGLGGTLDTRDAQLGGLIDLYWEYTGTGWVDLLREIGPSSDPDELAEAVAVTDLDENGIAWLTPASADSSFAIATGPNVADGLAVSTVGELGDLLDEDAEGVVVCLPEGGAFRDDPTGLPALGRALASPVPEEQLVAVPAEDLVPAAEAGLYCPFGQVRRTSPSLLDADLRLLDDDVGAFLIRNPTVTVRAEVLTDFPEMADVLDPVAAALTDEALRALNAAAADSDDPQAVARAWLVDEGFADR